MVWTLYDSGVTWRSFPGVLGGAVCRLKPGVIPWEVEAELRVLARQIKPTHSGSWVTVTPLREITSRPVVILAPLWNGVTDSRRIIRTRSLDRGGSARRSEMEFAEISGVFSVEMCFRVHDRPVGDRRILRIGRDDEYGWRGARKRDRVALGGLVGAVGALYLCWRDQRKRCRLCLCRLVMPVRIGYGARQLFEQSGAETVCPNGHGTLFESEGGAFPPNYRWAPLDITWRDLFRTPAKTKP